ncbi:7545_t:CDS:2, partial [Funneliformis caledonium]
AIYVWVGCNGLDSGNGSDAFDSSLSYSLIIDLSTANAFINGYWVLLTGAPLIMKFEVYFLIAISTIAPWTQNAYLISCVSVFTSVMILIIPSYILCLNSVLFRNIILAPICNCKIFELDMRYFPFLGFFEVFSWCINGLV